MNQPENAAVASPVLANRAEVWKSAGKLVLLKIRLFLITPDDVPLGIAQKGVVLGSKIIRNSICDLLPLSRPWLRRM